MASKAEWGEKHVVLRVGVSPCIGGREWHLIGHKNLGYGM